MIHNWVGIFVANAIFHKIMDLLLDFAINLQHDTCYIYHHTLSSHYTAL